MTLSLFAAADDATQAQPRVQASYRVMQAFYFDNRAIFYRTVMAVEASSKRSCIPNKSSLGEEGGCETHGSISL